MSTVRIQLRRGTAADWTSINPILAAGEAGYESDTKKIKIGDGSSTWTALGYATITPAQLSAAIAAGIGSDLTAEDVNKALGYTAADAADLSGLASQTSTDISDAITTSENYTDAAVATEVTNRNTAISAKSVDTLSQAETFATNADSVLHSVITGEVATAKTQAINAAEGYTDSVISSEITNRNSAIQTAVNNLVNSAPSTLDTLKEIADALTADEGTAATLATTVAGKLSKSGDSMTGDLVMGGHTVTSLGAPTGNTDAATKFYVDTEVQTLNTDLRSYTDSSKTAAVDLAASNAAGIYATKSAPTFTGTITASESSIDGITLKNNTVDGTKITDGTIHNVKIHDVDGSKIAIASITGDKIVSITEDQVTGLVTSLGLKADLNAPTFSGTVVLPATTSIGTTTATELGYVHGVTGSIQPQLTASSNHISATTNVHGISDTSALATKTYADSAASSAQSTAEAYTDSAISTEVANRNTAISTEATNRNTAIATAKSDAESYTDSAISTEVTNRNSAIATAKSQAISTAEGYTDTAISNLVNGAPSTLDTLKEIADALGSDANLSTTITNHIASAKSDAEAYTDSSIATEVTNRNSAILTAKNQAISTSESYTDSAISSEVSNRNSAIATSLSTSESYTDSAKAAAISTSESYTDSAIATEVTNRNSAILTAKNAAITTSENYTDNAISTEVTNRNSAIAGIVKTTDTGSVTSAMILDGTIVDEDISTSASIADTKLATITTSGKVANSATTATYANTASAIVARDASGNFTANLITVNTTPTANGHAASKAYVDNVASGMNWHTAVKAASTGNSGATYSNGTDGVGATLTADTNRSIATLDNASLVVGNRVLMKDQTDAKQNGIYVVTTLGSSSVPWVLTRASDANNSTPGQVTPGDAVYVQGGTVNGNQAFIETGEGTGTGLSIVLGTDSVTWTQFTGAANLTAGNGLTRTGNSIDVVSSTLNVTADAVDLATVSQTNTTGGNLANGIVSAITVDAYGRVTGYQTGAQNVASTSNKGIASFDSASFTVTSGNVVIKSAGISNTQLANSSITIGTTAIALGSSSTTLVGLTSVSSTGFAGALTGNADTATKLATARNINGVAFDGSAAITITAASPNALTIGTGLSGGSYIGSGAVTIAIDSTVATLTGAQTLTNKILTSPTIGTILNTGTLTLPTSTDTLIGKATIDTLTNKTFDTAGTGNVFKINGTQISANTGTGSNVLATSPSVTGLSTDTLSTTGNVTIGGNLTVNGTTTTINSTTLSTAEQVLVISNTATPTDVTANGAGIQVNGTTNKTFKWYSSTGSFNSSENINLATGKTIMINGTTVLSPTAVGGQTIPASAIVGLTDSQTLTNKTLTSPVITLPSAGITFADSTVQTTAATPSLTPIVSATGSITLNSTAIASAPVAKDSFVQMNVASANTVTIPADSTYSYPVGASIDFQQLGAGQTSFVAASGVTFQAASVNSTMALKFRGQFSVATALKVAANTWAIFGDLSI